MVLRCQICNEAAGGNPRHHTEDGRECVVSEVLRPWDELQCELHPDHREPHGEKPKPDTATGLTFAVEFRKNVGRQEDAAVNGITECGSEAKQDDRLGHLNVGNNDGGDNQSI